MTAEHAILRVRPRDIGLVFPALAIAVFLAVVRPWATPEIFDYGVFYCAARTIAAGGDASRVEPLRHCESALIDAHGRSLTFAAPAPLPAPVIAAFVPLARLPFPVSRDLWLGVLVAVCVAGLALLRRLVALPAALVCALVVVPLWIVPLQLGQLAPVAVTALCAAALAVRRGRDRAAALLALGAIAQPMLALAPIVALAIARPRSRATLVAGLVALAGASVWLVGMARTVGYLIDDVPLEARAELTVRTQYAFAFALAAAGAPAAVALAFGTCLAIACTVAGVIVACRLANRTGDGAFLIAIPAAFAVLGSPHVHAQQVAAAMPAALLLANRHGVAMRFVAPILLAFPMLPAITAPALYAPLFAFAAYAIARALGTGGRRAAIWALVPIAALACSSFFATGVTPAGPAPPPLPGSAAAGASWLQAMRWIDPTPARWSLLFKISTWAGLALVASRARSLAFATPRQIERSA